MQPPAGWFDDPFRRHERRYWDGRQWTHHVASHGTQQIDPPGTGEPPVITPAATPAAWFDDPFRRHERRYWDGRQWTHHVASHGTQQIDPAGGGTPAPTTNAGGPPGSHPPVVVGRQTWTDPSVNPPNKKIQQQVRRTGLPDVAPTGNEPLFTELVLVVNQKAKLFGVNSEYSVYDQQGRQIAAVREVNQRLIKKAMGAGGENGTHKFQIVAPDGRILIALHRPAKMLKSKMIVMGADGTQGEIVQKTLGFIGNVRFDLEAGGRTLGSINAEDWQAWDFNIQDKDGNEIARITKTWAGWAKERFTRADNYVVQIHRPLDEPLRTLAIAAALAVDTALKQGTQTSGAIGRRRYK